MSAGVQYSAFLTHVWHSLAAPCDVNSVVIFRNGSMERTVAVVHRELDHVMVRSLPRLTRAPSWCLLEGASCRVPVVTIRVPPASLRTLDDEPCARAALCFFGRVGNLFNRFDIMIRAGRAGSTLETLELSGPSIFKYFIGANPQFKWDLFAHTWDWLLLPHIKKMYHPLKVEGLPQPKRLDNVLSFGEAMRRAAALKAEEEKSKKFHYDLVVLMRYDILFFEKLVLPRRALGNTLVTSHWCSVNSEDRHVREVVLNESHSDDIRTRKIGVFAPSQFFLHGLHDWWFASSSETIDQFAHWGEAVEGMRERYRDTEFLPFHCGHFYTHIYANQLGLKYARIGIPYIHYNLARYRKCRIRVGDKVGPENIVCDHWTVSYTNYCESWVHLPPKVASGFCPIAGRLATLAQGSRDCGRF